MGRWLPAAAGAMALALTAAADPMVDVVEDRYAADPVLEQLMDWVTFQLSFDGESMTPDMAVGEWEPQLNGTPQFRPGVQGSALLAGSDSARAYYPRGPNATLGTRGAVSLWVCPVQWTRINGGNTTFVMTGNSTFYVQRQGPAHNEEGRATRHENLQYLVRGDLTGNVGLGMGTSKWLDGEWRLVVANWSWPVISWSIDGGELQSTTVKQSPDESYFGRLAVGATGGEPTLIDEITFYQRPLTLREIRLMYETFRPGSEEQQ